MILRLLGRLLKNVKAGEAHLAWNDASDGGPEPGLLTVTSPSFGHGGPIPKRHAGRGIGDDVSPALAWAGVPPETAELVLIVEDTGAPMPRPILHLLATSIPPTVSSVAEGRFSGPDAVTIRDGIVVGKNALGRRVYAGPGPIPAHGPHAYVFQLFALKNRLSFTGPPARKETVRQMRGAILARGRLDGLYER